MEECAIRKPKNTFLEIHRSGQRLGINRTNAGMNYSKITEALKKKRRQEYNLLHRDEIRESSRKYYQKNKKKWQEYYQKHRGKIRKQQQEHHLIFKKKIAKQQKEYYRKNRVWILRLLRDHKETSRSGFLARILCQNGGMTVVKLTNQVNEMLQTEFTTEAVKRSLNSSIRTRGPWLTITNEDNIEIREKHWFVKSNSRSQTEADEHSLLVEPMR